MSAQGCGKQKDLVCQNGKQGLKLCNFIPGKRQTFLPWKKQFGFAETVAVLVKMDYREKGNFLYPFPPPEKEEKTEKKKAEKEEKRKKFRKKKRGNFLLFFQLIPLCFPQHKE